ncbi:hypothetical protein PA598K_05689 [Paenibacillus sp. 598K]|uniref:ABC transporter permease n=1 Tax=Paenibacillus sp. 598K TaxID=1117987 RepID=UPI000FF96D6A|nr:ABC transporter permease [Paenibacillus sp. 598K]GBF77158.1 hypothetical protein PA598K_05689 [Paenibacillus sp. 598K]
MMDLMRLAWGQIWRRKIVTLLCMVGLSIGCTSIILAISISAAQQANSLAELNRNFKMDEITVMPRTAGDESGEAFNRGAITMQKLDIIRKLPHVTAVLPQMNLSQVELSTLDGKISNVQLIGTDLTALSDFGYKFEQGDISMMSDTIVAGFGASFGLLERQVKKELLDKLIADPENEELYMKWDELDQVRTDLFRQQVLLRRDMMGLEGAAAPARSSAPLRVRGVLQVKEGTSEEYARYDKQVYVSLETAGMLKDQLGLGGGPTELIKLDTLTVKVEDKRYVPQVENQLAKLFLNSQSNLFQEQAIQEQFAKFKKMAIGIGLFILFLASMSIFVAMTMSTHQRRRQIGVMKILGANLWQIRQLFIAEAAVLGLLGGIAGIVLSYGVVEGISAAGLFAMSETPLTVMPDTLPVGVAFSLVTGIASGIYPAISASRTNSLEVIKNG